MQSTRRLRSNWVVGLVLLPAAGLVALSVLGLQATVRDAERRARTAAAARARTTSHLLRERLREPSVVRWLPRNVGFTRRQNDLSIPAEVGWIEPPTIADPTDTLSLSALRRLEEARRAEFGDGDPDRALHALETAVEDEKGAWLMLQAAWVAQRAGREERVQHWRGRLETALNRDAALHPAIIAGLVMLERTRRHPLSEPLGAAFSRLPPSVAEPTLAELTRLDARDTVTALRQTLEDVHAWRTTLQGVSRAPLDWPTLEEPVARRLGDRILFYWPGEGGDGTGAWVPPQVLADALERAAPSAQGAGGPPELLSEEPWEGRLVGSFEPSDEALPIVPGLAILPIESDVPLPIWARPGAAAAILAALAVLLGLGLWLSARALRREAQAARARADFLTSITHELRTPLASIRLFAEMLADGRAGSEAQQREYLELLGGEAARLSVLVENVLDLGRAARGERGYDRRRQPIGPCLEHIVSVFAPLARRDGLELAVRLRDPETEVVLDAEALTQAVLNVLENARRYGAEGGRILLQGCRIEGQYRIEIRDEGPGVPAAERESIFDPFTRGGVTASGTVPGLGVGLSLSRTILRAHAGDLVLESQEGRGACFVASLPVAKEEEIT